MSYSCNVLNLYYEFILTYICIKKRKSRQSPAFSPSNQIAKLRRSQGLVVERIIAQQDPGGKYFLAFCFTDRLTKTSGNGDFIKAVFYSAFTRIFITVVVEHPACRAVARTPSPAASSSRTRLWRSSSTGLPL